MNGLIELLTPWLGALIILGYLSLLFYKENPWSRWVEYSIIALGIGWVVVYNTWLLVDYVVTPFQQGNVSVVVPVILGLLAYAQFSKKYRYLVRWPLAFISSVGLAVVLAGIPLSAFIVQFRSIAVPLTAGNAFDIVNAIIVIIGVITTLSYFIFTREHKGALAISAKVGRYFMMAAFGAGFGMAVISQGTFLLNVLIFLLRNWLHIY
jgi:hypothetical protein